jgi:predicted Zn-dependent peptidase
MVCVILLPLLATAIPMEGIEVLTPREDLRLIYSQDRASPATTVQIIMRGGRALVPPQKAGIAYLSHRLMLTFQDPQHRKQMVQWGARLQFQIHEDFSVLSLTCLSEHLDAALGIFAQPLADPPITSNRIFRNKKAMAYLQKMEEDDDQRFLRLALHRVFFEHTGQIASIYGDEASRKKIKTRDVRTYHQTVLVAANTFIAVCSDLDKEEISAIFAKNLPGFPSNSPASDSPHAPAVPNEKSRFFARPRRQTLLVTAAITPPLAPRTLVLGILLKNLLSSGPGSRLWYLRERKKLAYLVDAALLQLDRGGVLYLFLKTDPEKQEEARSEMSALVARLRDEGVDQVEFSALQRFSRADFLRRHETKSERAFALAYLEATGLGWRFHEKIPSEIQNTTLEEFNAHLHEIFHPERLVDLVIGPGAQAAGGGKSQASGAGW